MRLITTAAGLLALSLAASTALADDADKLIKLDKSWGAAKGPGDVKHLLAEKFFSVDEKGVGNRQDLLDAMSSEDAPEGPYVAGDYEVRFIDDKVAVMVHSAGAGEDKHWSMHVWRKHDGKWKVFATSSVAADD